MSLQENTSAKVNKSKKVFQDNTDISATFFYSEILLEGFEIFLDL